MRQIRRARWVSVAVVVALMAASCGDDGDDGDDGDSASGSDGENVRWDGREHTPLDQFMGWDDDMESTEEDNAQWMEEDRRIEELTADCMREEGFEYIPYVPDYGEMEDDVEEDGPWALWEEDPEEFAETYGYGLSTIEEDLESEDREAEADEAMADDPNNAIMEKMSPTELEAYELALYGDWPEVEAAAGALMEDDVLAEAEAGEPPPPEDRGCWDQAATEVYGEEEMFGTGEGEDDPIMEAYDTIDQQIADDPDVAAAQAKYIDCMADAGNTVTEMWGGEIELVWDRYQELLGIEGDDAASPADPGIVIAEDGATAESGEADDEDSDDQGSGDEDAGDTTDRSDVEDEDYPTLADVDPDDLKELQDYEIEVAVAEYRCIEESEYEDVEYDVRVRVEQEYIDANRDELEQARDAMELEGAG